MSLSLYWCFCLHQCLCLCVALTVAVCSQSSQLGTGALRRGPKVRWSAAPALEVSPFLIKEKLDQFLDKRKKRDFKNKGDTARYVYQQL